MRRLALLFAALLALAAPVRADHMTGGGTSSTTVQVIGPSPVTITATNEGSTGTVQYKLARFTTSGTVKRTATTDTTGAIGPCISGCGTTGTATIQLIGNSQCVFDGATTAGDYVGISSSVAGDCTDLGSTFPDNLSVLGIVTSTNGSAGTYAVIFDTPDIMNATNITGGNPGKGNIGNLSYSGKLNVTGMVSVSSNGSVGASTRVENCTSGSSAITRTLPAATGTGRVVDLHKVDSGSGTCIFGRTGSDAINSGTTRTLSSQWNGVTCMDIASAQWICRGDGS